MELLKVTAKLRRMIIALWMVMLIVDQASFSVKAGDVIMGINEKANSRRIDIAVPAFKGEEQNIRSLATGDQIKEILMNDLDYSSVFHPIDISQFYDSSGAEQGTVNFKQWYLVGMQALVAGNYTFREDDIILKARLYDVPLGQEIIGKAYQGPTTELRRMVHRLADELVLRFTGEQGIACSHIALVSLTEKGVKEICLMDYDGYNKTQLTQDHSLNLSPALSPDGRFVAYTSYKSGQPNLVMMDLSTKKVDLLAQGGLNIAPSFSADGSKIVFSREVEGNPEIFTLDVASHALKRLTFYNGIDSSPDWSPNGQQIVFTSDRSGGPQLWTMDSEGGNINRLTFIGDYNDGAAWSPRGDRIAFHSRLNGIFEICTINADGSLFTQLTNNVGNCESPAWSPDGRQLVYAIRSGDHSKIVRLQLNTGKLTDIGKPDSSGGWSSPSWSK